MVGMRVIVSIDVYVVFGVRAVVSACVLLGLLCVCGMVVRFVRFVIDVSGCV